MTKITLLLCLCFTELLFAQHPPQSADALKATYKTHFNRNRESVYLQLNKTKFLPTEALWFAAYVYDSKVLTPNQKTTNLHVNVYNDKGTLLKAKTVFIHNGIGKGFFKLDTALFHPGRYIIKAYTAYMKNFKQPLAFRQGFEIIGQPSTTTTNTTTEYDLQLLPEGGHLLVGTQNTVGVKLIDNHGRTVPFTDAKVINQHNETVTTFKSNRFGMSKFTFNYQPNHHYRVELTPHNSATPISLKVPQPHRLGLALTINNLLPETLYITLRTNMASLAKLGGKKFYIALHRQGVLETIPLTFPKDQTIVTAQLSKHVLATGINIVTVFNADFKPLLERQLFYSKPLKRKHLQAKLFQNFGDSIAVNLSSTLKKGKHRLSISILPEKTKAYRPKNNIISSFYIEPYIKGDLIHGSYYFSEGQRRRKAYDLDLLLLTQGWSQYDWHDIFEGQPTEFYPPEHGFTLSGRVNNSKEKGLSKLMIKSKTHSFFQVLPLDDNRRFSTKHLYLTDNTDLAFSLIGQKHKTAQPKIYTRINPVRDQKPLTTVLNSDFASLTPTAASSKISSTVRAFMNSAHRLDSVFLIAEDVHDEDQGNTATYTIGHRIHITETMEQLYFYVTDLIRARGFSVHRSMTGVSISTTAPMSLRGAASPVIELDGIRLIGDNTPLINLKTSEVKSITINKMGSVMGINGAGGYIKIETNFGDLDYINAKKTPTTRLVKLKNGFAMPKDYYEPLYRNYYSDIFAYYGAIDWLPNVQMNTGSGSKTIKVLNTAQPSIKLYIEGMTADGSLISDEITVKTQ